MAHISLGYKIVDGCAVVDEPTVEQIKNTYKYYFEGKSLINAAKEAGLCMKPASIKRMLSNKKYLGTDYYPQIIDKETIEKFEKELTRRAAALGRLNRKGMKRNSTVPTVFHFQPAELTFADPFEQVSYIYSLIEREE